MLNYHQRFELHRMLWVRKPEKQLFSYLDSLAKWLSVRLQTKWLWVRVPFQSLKLQISHLFRARSSLKFRQLQSVDSLWNMLNYHQRFELQRKLWVRKHEKHLFSYLASLAKWLSVRLRTKWLWVRVPFQSLKLQILRLFRARSSLKFRQL